MALHPADKKMLRTYLVSVEKLAESTFDTAVGIKDRELSRHLEKIAEDLNYVTTDMHDTLDRL